MDKELMTLAKKSVSIVETSTLKDEEIEMWINAGKEDLLIKSAIVMFVKANFGNVDIKEKELAQRTYNLLCHSLGLSNDYKVVDKDA